MKSKMGHHLDFPMFNVAKDLIALITKMRNIVCGREALLQGVWSLCKLIKLMLREWQKDVETNEEWMEQFHGMWEAVKQHGGSLWSHLLLVQDRVEEISQSENIPTAAKIPQAEQAVKVR